VTLVTVPLKRVASIRVSNVDKKSVEGDMPVRLCNYTDVYYRDVIRPDQHFMEATATGEQIRAFQLRAGDVVITKDSETAGDIGVPAYVEMSDADLVCGYHLAIVRPAKSVLDGRFLFWSMASTAVREQLTVAATGVTRYGLRSDSISGTTISLPELSEQHRIADGLDAETTRIDALLAKKMSLLGLLRSRLETRAADMTLAGITVGLNGGGATVPDGWRTPRIRRCLAQVDYGIGEASQPTGRVSVLGMGNVDDAGRVTGKAGGYVESVAPEMLLRSGDLLFNRTNSLAKVGKVGLVRELPELTTFASYLVRFRVAPFVRSEYLNYALNTNEVLGLARSAALPSIGQANLNPSRYGDLLIALPPLEEQERIVAELDAHRLRLEELEGRLFRQVALLREHRQALITAAVNGELKVA